MRLFTPAVPRHHHPSRSFLAAGLAFFLLLLTSSSAPARRTRVYRVGKPVTIRTRDGIDLFAVYAPRSGRSRKTMVLVHGLAGTNEDWLPLARRLVRSGCGLLAYDARGHGNSVSGPDGTQASYHDFGSPGAGSEWEKMLDDLDDVISFLAKEKGLSRRTIGIAGAGLGANICMSYAAGRDDIAAVLLLSPGLDYAGIDGTAAAAAFPDVPLAIAVSRKDTYAYQSALLLLEKLRDRKPASFITGAEGHGTHLLGGSLDARIVRWLNRVRP